MNNTEYMAPTNLSDLFRILEEWEGGRARFIAGGTNLIPYMRDGVLSPALILDLGGIKDLAHIREKNGVISIGAMTTIADIVSSDIIRNKSPILSSAARHLGNPLVRNRATIGGNLANASPGADMVPALLALEASVHTERGGGRHREIPIDKFFIGKNRMVMEDDEMLKHITFPKPKNPGNGRQIKLGLRNAGAISLMNIALILDLDGKICRKARIGLCPVAPTPIRAYRTEGMLEGKEIDDGLLDECSAVLKGELKPRKVSIRASAEYRMMVASVLFKRAVKQVLKECGL